MKVFEKLLNIQTRLKAPKGQYNSFGGYTYRSCEDILEAAKPILTEVKAVVKVSDTLELIGTRYYIKATATLIDIESGEEISSTAYAREEETKKGMDQSQVTGAASSYARKYALNGLFAIDDVKDSDSTNIQGNETSKQTPTTSKTPTPTNNPPTPQTSQETANNSPKLICEECQAEVTDKVAKFSKDKYGRVLCYTCQKKPAKTDLAPVEDDGIPF